MPLDSHALGAPTGSLDVTPDVRWTMSYAAGVPDERPELYATDAGVVVHPLFPVGPEWQLIIAQRGESLGLTLDEARRGIHIGHDLVHHLPIVPGETLHLDGRTIAVDRRRAGATQTVLLTATSNRGIVWRTRTVSLYLGVELQGEPAALDVDWPATPSPPTTAGASTLQRTSTVRTIDAHVYSECARIWNPIHTDVVAARRSGLAEPILHGTATLARAVSIATDLVGVPIGDVTRVAATFRAPVRLGSTFDVRVLAHDSAHVWFDAVNPDGSPALADGLLALNP